MLKPLPFRSKIVFPFISFVFVLVVILAFTDKHNQITFKLYQKALKIFQESFFKCLLNF